MVSERDPCSLANVDEVCCTHAKLQLRADFEKHELQGTVTLVLHFLKEKPSSVILDSRDLTIKQITVQPKSGSSENGVKVDYKKGETSSKALGDAIEIDLSQFYQGQNPILTGKVGEAFLVTIAYHTSKDSVAIQWLNPEQTEGKKHPYLFTQFQPIHCRSAIPCQDSPFHKITYEAVIEVPEPLTALMSALAESKESVPIDGKNFTRFSFSQKVPIPSYLIALVIGNLEQREVGPISAVWAEPEVVERAAWEFANTDEYLQTAISLMGEYEWGRYDLLCLPGSFPYGGMENPCLTFITPTLLAGDRSLTSVVAHEIAHSWTGNLVTNATWEHFWLNEGFTVYTEFKILGRLFGEPTRHLNFILGNTDLINAVNNFGPSHEYTRLVPKLLGVNPDDAFSSIPYEKGSQFLFYLESKVGDATGFEEFLRKWIQTYKFKSVTTDDFRAFFQEHYSEAYKQVDWDSWVGTTGMPPVEMLPMFDHSAATTANQLVGKWLQATSESPDPDASEYEQLTTFQKILFLDKLHSQSPDGVAHSKLALLNSTYHFSEAKNSEILMNWLSLCLDSKDETCFDTVVRFVTEQGRMKFVRPLYKKLAACNESGKTLAHKTFLRHQNYYHNIAKNQIQEDLGLVEKKSDA